VQHLLFLTDWLQGMGGAERNLVLLARQFRKRGYRVTILCLTGGAVSDLLEKDGFSVHVIGGGRVFSLNGMMRLKKIRSIVRRQGVAAIFCYHLSSDIFGAGLALTTGVPVISNRRDLGFRLTDKHNRLYQFINRFYAEIIAVSSAVKDVVVKTQSVSPDMITVIYNAVSPDLLAGSGDIEVALSPDFSKVNICCLANLREIKGQNYLLEAVHLLEDSSRDFCLYLLGDHYAEDPYYHDLLKKFQEWELEDRVVFCGGIPSDEVFAILQKMDISVLPSLSEGMPNTLLESMAAGLPVVATAVGGTVEVVKDGETGYLVPPKNPAKLADALHKLIANRTERESMAKQAVERFEKHFSVDIMVDRYEELLGDVTGKKRS